MSVPRLILAGVEPGPALDLVAGALLAGFGEQRATRAILLGFDLPLWRLVYDVAARAPRALDPALHPAPVADELFDQWSEHMDLTLVVGVRPLLDGWEGVNGSRAADLARRLDAPIVLVLDARGRGASAAAAVYGTRALASQLEIGGVVLVGGDDSSVGRELLEALRRDVALPVLGHIPPQLTEQFLRQYAAASGSVRTLGARAPETTLVQLCREAATYLQLDEIAAVAARRGFLPSAPRRLLLPETSATDLVVAVAWGAPLQPVMLENVDVLQAMGVNLVPLNISRDRELPEPCDGLLFTGTLDEQTIDAFSDNALLRQDLRTAAAAGLPHAAPGMHRKHYSPRTPLLLIAPGERPVGGRGAVVSHRSHAHGVVRMSADPKRYAAALYATLHELDGQGYDWIAVERVPELDAWAGIRDRLTRAAAHE